MQEEDYTFVTLDGEDALPADAVMIDVEEGASVDLGADVVVAEDDLSLADHADFITLADDTVMLSDTDTLDLYSMDMDEVDISFTL